MVETQEEEDYWFPECARLHWRQGNTTLLIADK